MKIAAIVPVKLKSRRLPNKNFLNLGGAPLSHYIFETLSQIEEIDHVFCYTSQKQVMSLLNEKIELLPRPAYLDGDDILGNELFGYAVNALKDYDIIIICHPTSPFIAASSIVEGIDAVLSGEYDSAFSVEKHSKYAWFQDQPINYDPLNMAQTQGLSSVYMETSGFYVFLRESYQNRGTRIGSKPKMIEVDRRESIDIDYPSDFVYAKYMLDYVDAVPPGGVEDFDFFVGLAQSSGMPAEVLHVSFDFDGVLIDSLEAMRSTWGDVCKELSMEIPFSEYKKHVGIPLKQILIEIGVPERLQADAYRLYVDYSTRYQDKVEVVEGMPQLLSDLRAAERKITIVTSKPRERALELVSRFFGESLLDLLVTPEDIPSHRGKPAPDSLLHACCTVGADPSSSIYIGDMDVDRVAAKRANMHFVHAAWGYQQLPRRDEVWFAQSADLIDYVRQVCKLG